MAYYRKKRLIFLNMVVCLLAMFASCVTKNEPSISAKNLKYLKSKYNVATINYFYETVFHEDFSVEKQTNIFSKWTYSPKIAIVSNQNTEERRYVQRAINQVNALNLPIKYTLTDSKDSAAIKVFFGDFEQVYRFLNPDSTSVSKDDPHNSYGTVRAISYDGIMDRANIGIYFKDDLDSSGRYKIVLEEIIQSFGAGGDSYNYPGSLFFENENPAKSLTQLDVDVLSLFYESAIPINYSRQAFEKDFSAELYAVNTTQKIKDLLHKNPQYSAADIEKCFTKGILLKHPKETSIHLSGDVQKEDSLTVAHAILSLNKISPNIKIKLTGATSGEPGFGIFLNLRHSDHQKQTIRGTNKVIWGKNCMFPKLTKNKITLSFHSGKIDPVLRQRSIIDALYFSLIPMPQKPSRTNQLFTVNGNYINFTPRYVNLMKAIYSNEFLDGLKLSDFMKVKSSVVK